MLRSEVTVKDIDRKYDHPLAEIVQIASQFSSEILLEYDKYRINAIIPICKPLTARI